MGDSLLLVYVWMFGDGWGGYVNFILFKMGGCLLLLLYVCVCVCVCVCHFSLSLSLSLSLSVCVCNLV